MAKAEGMLSLRKGAVKHRPRVKPMQKYSATTLPRYTRRDPALSKKSDFHYGQHEDQSFELSSNVNFRLQHDNVDFARLYLVDNCNKQLKIPRNITMVDNAGHVIPPSEDEFIITWVASFNVYVDGKLFMQIVNPKQHTIYVADTVTSRSC